MQKYADIKKKLDETGFETTQDEFNYLVSYARRKARAAGKDESYLPYLLPDVVKEYFFRSYINGITALRMAGVEI